MHVTGDLQFAMISFKSREHDYYYYYYHYYLFASENNNRDVLILYK